MQATSAVQRPFALAAALALILSALVAAASPAAKADTFTPGAAAPVVTITDFSNVIQPFFENSSDADPGVAYFVTVEVVDSDGVDTIETVSICLFNGDSNDGAGCDAPDADPKTMFYMDWLADGLDEGETYGPGASGSSGFEVGNSDSLYAIGGGADVSSWATDGGTTPGTLTLTFRFYVSAAMLAGSDWTIRATATDNTDGAPKVGTATTATNAVTVQYFGAVTTTRTSIDYGTIAPEESAARLDQSLGRFVANDESETDLVGEDFTYSTGPSFTSTLALVDKDTPGSGEVSLRCWRGDAALGATSILVVPDTARDLPSSVFGGAGAARGTGEEPLELKHGCELSYGGGATVSSQQHQADITVGIRQVVR
jgi:hypothetical protein